MKIGTVQMENETMYEEYRIGSITMSDRTEYISRQAAIDAVRSYYDEFDEREESIEERIEQLPSAKPDVPDTNVGDMISRQVVIDALGERPMVWTSDDDYSLGERNQYDADRFAIETVPSADIDLSGFSDRLWKTAYERDKAEAVRWIPCSERLPAKKTEVIYSLENHYVSTGYMTDRDYNGDEMELHWEDMESGALIYPEAWMPLPKPYEGSE